MRLGVVRGVILFRFRINYEWFVGEDNYFFLVVLRAGCLLEIEEEDVSSAPAELRNSATFGLREGSYFLHVSMRNI